MIFGDFLFRNFRDYNNWRFRTFSCFNTSYKTLSFGKLKVLRVSSFFHFKGTKIFMVYQIKTSSIKKTNKESEFTGANKRVNLYFYKVGHIPSLAKYIKVSKEHIWLYSRLNKSRRNKIYGLEARLSVLKNWHFYF